MGSLAETVRRAILSQKSIALRRMQRVESWGKGVRGTMIHPSPMWGIIQIVILVGLCFAGIPVSAALGVAGIIFALLYYGGLEGLSLLAITCWSNTASYSMSMLPLFILMGSIGAATDLGVDAYDCFYKWLARVKGGLSIVTTFTCAAFGAVTGSNAAAIITIGGIAVPEMKKRGYNAKLRGGSVAASGTLANLIPPSIGAIIYCFVTQVSIGRVLIGLIIPGITLSLLYSIVTYTWVSINPALAPVGKERFSLKEKLLSLQKLVPILGIFFGVLGGMFTGLFSPTEAAAGGVFFVAVLTLLYRRLTWKAFKKALLSTVTINAFIMLLVIGAMMFGYSLALTRLPGFVSDLIMATHLGLMGQVFLVILVVVAFGFVLDVIPLCVLFAPLFLPTIKAAGFDPVWFGVLFVVLMGVATLTPPVAYNIYVTLAVDKDAKPAEVIYGVLPYWIACFVLLFLMVIFPKMAMWLPTLMM